MRAAKVRKVALRRPRPEPFYGGIEQFSLPATAPFGSNQDNTAYHGLH